MTEYLYLSSGKLGQWSVGNANQSDFARLSEVVAELRNSDRYCSSATDERLGAGQWFYFNCDMRYGYMHRDSGSPLELPSSNIVFFVGSVPAEGPQVDLMLGGWGGHLKEEYERSTSLRMGSRTDHLHDLWNEVARADQSGDSRIPDEFRRLPRETSPGDRVPLDVVARWAHGMAAHYLPKETLMPMEGIARVLALLESDGYERSLVLATPLYVAFHETEEPRDGGQRIATDSLRRMQRWSSLRRV